MGVLNSRNLYFDRTETSLDLPNFAPRHKSTDFVKAHAQRGGLGKQFARYGLAKVAGRQRRNYHAGPALFHYRGRERNVSRPGGYKALDQVVVNLGIHVVDIALDHVEAVVVKTAKLAPENQAQNVWPIGVISRSSAVANALNFEI